MKLVISTEETPEPHNQYASHAVTQNDNVMCRGHLLNKTITSTRTQEGVAILISRIVALSPLLGKSVRMVDACACVPALHSRIGVRVRSGKDGRRCINQCRRSNFCTLTIQRGNHIGKLQKSPTSLERQISKNRSALFLDSNAKLSRRE